MRGVTRAKEGNQIVQIQLMLDLEQIVLRYIALSRWTDSELLLMVLGTMLLFGREKRR